MEHEDLVTPVNYCLSFHIVVFSHFQQAVWCTVTEDPDIGFVEKIRLNVDAIDGLLCRVGKSQVVLV